MAQSDINKQNNPRTLALDSCVKKTYVRNVENTITSKEPISPFSGVKILFEKGKREKIKSTQTLGSVPKQCSSLRITDSLQSNMLNNDVKHVKSSFFQNRDTDKFLKSKASQKINIPFEEHLYKDLIELKVTEKDIYAVLDVTAARTKESAKPRDNEPCLKDFYKPDFSHEFVISPPDVHLEVEKKRYFDGFGVTHYLDKC